MEKSENGSEIDWLGLKLILDYIIQNGNIKMGMKMHKNLYEILSGSIISNLEYKNVTIDIPGMHSLFFTVLLK